MTSVVIGEPDGLVRGIVERAFHRADGIDTTTVTRASQLPTACQAVSADVVVTAPRLDLPVHPYVPRLLAGRHRVLLLCSDLDDPMVTAALLAGASGCVSVNDSRPSDVVASALATARGEAVLHHDVALAIMRQWRESRRAVTEAGIAKDLTKREREVLAAAADGLTTAAIGRRLGIATKTVEAHKTRIFAKLGTRDQAHAVMVALRRGLLAPPSERSNSVDRSDGSAARQRV